MQQVVVQMVDQSIHQITFLVDQVAEVLELMLVVQVVVAVLMDQV